MLKQNRRVRNIELRLAYVGTKYFGWQIQPHRPTVQGMLQARLTRILGEPIATTGASRTDTGVHAHDQHVSFQTANPIPLQRLALALGHLLPPGVQVLSVAEREPNFSARHHARAKHYSYFWVTAKAVSPFIADSVWRLSPKLDGQAMNRAAAHLLGTRCFKALQSAKDRRRGSTTTLLHASVSQHGNLVCCDILGQHFLYHMVRNIAGALTLVGRGEWTPDEFLVRLEGADRTAMGMTAPAAGLHLFQVYYDDPPYELSPERDRFSRHLALFC